MPIAFVFPGQGSQAVGMGRDLAAAHAAARAVFEEVDDTLDQKLSRLMFDGPPETLQLTENTQPALMAHSMAALRVMETEGGFRLADRAVLVAGHSLGEYTALAAAGAFGVAQAAQLLRIRGTAMQAAVPVGEGAMAALIGTDIIQALEICAEASQGETVEPANDNGGGQVVISGHKAAVERAIEISRARGVKRVMLLPVSAPFHCALMAPAAAVMAEALEQSPPLPPGPPVVANVTATREDDPATISRLLVEQVTATVRWRESVLAMAAIGIDTFVEVGAGRVLAGLIRRILPEATTYSAGTPGEIDAVLKAL